jgi:hypothetical protein
VALDPSALGSWECVTANKPGKPETFALNIQETTPGLYQAGSGDGDDRPLALYVTRIGRLQIINIDAEPDHKARWVFARAETLHGRVLEIRLIDFDRRTLDTTEQVRAALRANPENPLLYRAYAACKRPHVGDQ